MTAGMGKTFHEGSASGLVDDPSCPLGSHCPGLVDDPSCPLCRGEYDADYSWTEPYFMTNLDETPSIEYDDKYALSWMATDPDKGPLPDDYVRRQAISRLDNISSNRHSGKDVRPFFMAVGFHKPHLPFVFPERYLSYYPIDEVQLPSNPDVPINMPTIAATLSQSKEMHEYKDISDITDSQLTPGELAVGATGNEPLPDAKVKDLRRAYHAAISYADDNVGKVLAALSKAKLSVSTIVVVLSDHGWSLGEHGQWSKHTNFATVTQAPLMFRVPGLTHGGIYTDQIASTTDIFPTLVDLVFETAMPRCVSAEKLCTEGNSLVPLISDPMTPVKVAAYSFFDRPIPTKVDKDWTGDWANSGAGGSDTNTSSSRRHRRPKHAVSLDQSTPAISRCIDGSGCVLGYSMVTRLEGCELRYTEWVRYEGKVANWAPNWDAVAGRELYNHSCYCSPTDHRRHKVDNIPDRYLAPMFYVDVQETNNTFSSASAAVVAELHERLRRGWQLNFD